jgi:hypothetical protein
LPKVLVLELEVSGLVVLVLELEVLEQFLEAELQVAEKLVVLVLLEPELVVY